ncbi:hypothetical protein BpHYR1_005284 [Brachionus plicatilis]|uniref:Uncharacterized protein n=1 Tax=Brachionus plicatilis TaxID=10195 RepID=A0A3M7R6X7_BRAPC|nr:hypothetical protein BpHYR1_005284 [Brachionus plicatilis]
MFKINQETFQGTVIQNDPYLCCLKVLEQNCCDVMYEQVLSTIVGFCYGYLIHAQFLAKTDKVKTKNAPKNSKNKCDLTQFEQVEFEKLQSQFKDKLTSTESYKNELNDINQILKEGLELISNSIIQKNNTKYIGLR